MELNEFLVTVTQAVIIPLLIALGGFAVKWINAKANEIEATTENKYIQKYILMLNNTITTAVIAVNQTYVDALKDQNAFDKAAQEEAFKRVYETVMLSITEDAEAYLQQMIGDISVYVTTKIEEQVKLNKTKEE